MRKDTIPRVGEGCVRDINAYPLPRGLIFQPIGPQDAYVPTLVIYETGSSPEVALSLLHEEPRPSMAWMADIQDDIFTFYSRCVREHLAKSEHDAGLSKEIPSFRIGIRDQDGFKEGVLT
ncbi:hypothetical protein HYR69_11610 [Candidatus Sumerlaeota bacterium]|nr:hypothetical protein [Candidatus Sumerlaeota bacterium]